MAEEFTPITTQEAFDAAITARLNRQKETLENGFKAERETLQNTIREHETTIGTLRTEAQKYADQEKTIGELKTQIAGYERTALTERVAEAAGLSRALAGRLRGETEEELTADAAELVKLVGAPEAPKPSEPLADYSGGGTVDAAWGEMLSQM